MTEEAMIDILEGVARENRRKLPILRSGPKECNGCGFCCQFYESIDIEYDDPNYDWLNEQGFIAIGAGTYAMDRMEQNRENRCMALTGTPGVDAQCSIYDHRPGACREFEAGADRCRSVLILEKFRCLGGRKLS